MQPSPDPETIPSQIPPEIEEGLRRIGRVIEPAPTAALYAHLHRREPYEGAHVARGQRYGADERHLLDVFWSTSPAPAPAAGAPVLVFVHGGGFTGGDRRAGSSPFYDNIMLWATAHAMVGVNMTYRLAPAHPWPAAQQDLRAAIGWMRENIARYGGDPAHLVVVGHSAGAAHVAQYLGHSRFHAVPGSGVAAAVLVSGIFDPSTSEPTTSIRAYFGEDASHHPELSALPGMGMAGVPVLIVFAERDPPQFKQQAEQAAAELAAQGCASPIVQLLGHSHLSEIYAINTEDRALSDRILGFVRKHA